MSDVKKWYIGVYGGDAQARPCSPAEFEIIHAGEGRCFVLAEDFDNATRLFLDAAERCVASERREKELQQRLTAADEREDRRAAQTNDDLIAIARTAALNSAHRYNYMPTLPEDAYKWEPHWWVVEAMRAALDPIESASAPEACIWKFGAFSWHTGCGTEWMLNDGTPEQNGMHFCHSCGKTLVVEEDDAEAEKDDDWHMNPCKQGHRDVGAAGGVAACNQCGEKIEAANTQEAFEQWNAAHPAS